MGKENKLFLVHKTGVKNFNEDHIYSPVLGMVEMGKDYGFDTFVNRMGIVTNCFFYDLDGNTEILKDDYGKPLLELTPETLRIYVNAQAQDTLHSGLVVLKGLLDACKQLDPKLQELLVFLVYGH